MPIARATRFFDPSPEKVRSLSGVAPVDVFNNGIVPTVSTLVGDPEVDLDDEDARATRRREDQALFDETFAFERKRADDAFLGLGDARETQEPDVVGEALRQDAGGSGATGDLISFVKDFEGFSDKAFGDFKQTSIGYGTRARKGEKTISREVADQRLRAELATHRSRVVNHAKKHGYNFSERQIDALTSFDFNTGRLEQLTADGTRTPETIAERITQYNKAGGKVLKGLQRRRKAEQQLFLKG